MIKFIFFPAYLVGKPPRKIIAFQNRAGLNGIRTHDLCDTGSVLYRLSYQAIWELIMKDHIFELRRMNICNKYMIFHIFICILHFYGYITNSRSDQLPDGLIAQPVEHCTGIAEVIGSNPVQT